MDLGNWTWLIKLCSKLLDLLSYLASPSASFWDLYLQTLKWGIATKEQRTMHAFFLVCSRRCLGRQPGCWVWGHRGGVQQRTEQGWQRPPPDHLCPLFPEVFEVPEAQMEGWRGKATCPRDKRKVWKVKCGAGQWDLTAALDVYRWKWRPRHCQLDTLPTPPWCHNFSGRWQGTNWPRNVSPFLPPYNKKNKIHVHTHTHTPQKYIKQRRKQNRDWGVL